jgi:hypothetical protein
VRKISAKRAEDNSLDWYVDVEYSTPENKEHSATSNSTGGGTGSEPSSNSYTNPESEYPTIKTWTIEKEEPLYSVYDVNNNVVKFPQSSACEIFDPPQMIRRCTLGLSISRNENIGSAIVSLCGVYQNSTNSDWFFGAAPGTMLCKNITVERQVKQVPGVSLSPSSRLITSLNLRGRDGISGYLTTEATICAAQWAAGLLLTNTPAVVGERMATTQAGAIAALVGQGWERVAAYVASLSPRMDTHGKDCWTETAASWQTAQPPYS